MHIKLEWDASKERYEAQVEGPIEKKTEKYLLQDLPLQNASVSSASEQDQDHLFL